MDRLCKKCGELKPIECFRIIHGLYYHQCKDCQKEYNRQWRERNKEWLKEWMSEYYKCNKEIILNSHEQWYKKNPGYNKKYYADNKDRLKAQRKKWKADNPEKLKLYKAKRKAIKKGVPSDFNIKDLEAIYKKQKGMCFYCGANLKDNYHIDHFMPLSKGGNNHPSNIRLACQKCNCSKGAKNPYEFIQTEFLRLF